MTDMDETRSPEVVRPGPVALALGGARSALGLAPIAATAANRALERTLGGSAALDRSEADEGRASRWFPSRIPGLDATGTFLRTERRRNEEAATRFFAALVPEI